MIRRLSRAQLRGRHLATCLGRLGDSGCGDGDGYPSPGKDGVGPVGHCHGPLGVVGEDVDLDASLQELFKWRPYLIEVHDTPPSYIDDDQNIEHEAPDGEVILGPGALKGQTEDSTQDSKGAGDNG